MKLKQLYSVAGLLTALAVIFGFFTWQQPSFAGATNVEILARQVTPVALAALGMTFVIISGMIDLSVGSVVALVTVVIATCLHYGMSPGVSILLGVGTGVASGLLNGILITRLRVNSFIITLGYLLIFRGLAKGISHEQTVNCPDTWIPTLTASLPKASNWQIFPPGVWIFIACALAMAWILRATRFGRHVVAVGSNENAARLCGVPVERVQVAVFGIMGLFAGLAGLMTFSHLTIGDPTVADGLELQAIAAVVIGGASLTGGQGSIFGSVIGAFIMYTIYAGGGQLDWPTWVQSIVTGFIIIVAVALDKWRQARGLKNAS